jgi:hypothetical protein
MSILLVIMKTALYLQASAIRIRKKKWKFRVKNVCFSAAGYRANSKEKDAFLVTNLLWNNIVTNWKKIIVASTRKSKNSDKKKKFHKPFKSSSVQGKIIGKWNWILSRAITPPAKFELSFLLL